MNSTSPPPFKAPWWLPGGNLQTIWPALYATRFEGAAPTWQRERWTTPDNDFLDIDWLADRSAPSVAEAYGTHTAPAPLHPPAPITPESRASYQPEPPKALLVMFHGLEGSSASHYAQALAHWCRQRNIAMCVPHFRGCSGEINTAARAYHSGDWEEIDWILRRCRMRFAAAWRNASGAAPLDPDATFAGVLHAPPVVALGVSLGGNALMRWAGELGASACAVVKAVASVSSPLDLAASGHAIGRGFNRQVYTRMFLSTMKPRALVKLAQHPGLFDRNALMASRDLYEFDNVFTAPLHGFADTDDYWQRASAKPHLPRVQVPALCLNARNDPFMPAASLPTRGEVSPHVELWQPEHGGHVGFAQGPFPTNVAAMPQAAGEWLLNAAGVALA